MKLLDLTFPLPAENLACDEALLDACEEGLIQDEVLRFWESRTCFVVVGYSNRAAVEVNEEACRHADVPVLRRCSGGGTVVQGPGCLNFSLVLKIPAEGPLAHVTGTNQFVMERHRTALRPLLGEDCRTRGTTDLALGEQKFSGNAQRRRKRFLLFHGTFLHGFDLPSIARLLHFPSRQPEYRQGRSHLEFVRNVPVGSAAIKAALVQAWDAQQPLAVLPLGKIQHLVASRYGIEDWNRKF